MSVVALRYAHAFAAVAASTHIDTNAAQQQLSDFSGTLADSHDLREVLMNPSIAAAFSVCAMHFIGPRLRPGVREMRRHIPRIPGGTARWH